MAEIPELPHATLLQIARQIGQRMPRVTLTTSRPGELGLQVNVPSVAPLLQETFPVWFLPLERITTGNDDLELLAERTAYWHHQVTVGARAEVYARSKTDASLETAEVTEFAKSQVAHSIDDAIKWIDGLGLVDNEARMLLVPSYGLTAIWMHSTSGDIVVVADRPEFYPAIARAATYTAADFLALLRASEPASGIPPKESEP